MIELENIRLALDRKPVLRGFDLQAETGLLTLMVGPNGAGKSSSLKVASGLWKPSSGSIRVDGLDLSANPGKANRLVGYLPQSPAFHPRLKTFQVARFYASLEGRPADEADAAIELFGLDLHATQPTGKLSGGLRQRLGLAVLSLSRAPVLLLDEPGLSLDPLWRERLHGWLNEESRTGRTILVATHLLGEWEGRADACYLCSYGRVVGQLDPANLQHGFPASLDLGKRSAVNE